MKNSLRWILPLLLLGGIPFTMLYTAKTDNPAARLYQTKCANCHMEQGQGLRQLIPPLAQADYLARTAELACIIRYGMQGEVTVNGVIYNQPMPDNPDLNETDIANLINYIRNEWGNEYPYVSVEEVKKHLEQCDK